MAKSKVYFTKTISPEKVLEMYKLIGKELPGKIACKVHTGETGNQNFLHPEFWKPVIDAVGGTVVECNTAYPGDRQSTPAHKKVIANHGWDKFFTVDIMDGTETIELEVPNGKIIKQDNVGKNILNYDSVVVLSHFKGHPMGGFGGALKQLSIGFGSTAGKMRIHTAGKFEDGDNILCDDGARIQDQDGFLEAMADAASAVVKHFNGNMVFINVMANLSVDCDCVGFGQAADPCMKDVGVLVSLDPIAIDQACIDLVKNSDDPGKEIFLERVNSLNGTHTIDAAADLGFGTKDYELIEVE